MHGGFAAQEMVVKQKVSTHACVNSLQRVSPVNGLLPFSGVVRTWTEVVHRMLSIVDLDANHTLLGVRQKFARTVALVATNSV